MREDGAARIEQALESGAAAEIFGRMVAAQGGPADFVERWPDRLPAAPVIMEVSSAVAGSVLRIDGQALGLAVVALGGGRQREGDRINPSVGLSDLAGLGEEVGPGDPIWHGACGHRSAGRGGHCTGAARPMVWARGRPRFRRLMLKRIA